VSKPHHVIDSPSICSSSRRQSLAKDALGQWLLSREGNDSTEKLFSLETQEAFAQFVLDEREASRLKRDDTTLLVFW
jgi:hypothetical protein